MPTTSELIKRLEEKNLRPTINLDRPTYVQPEDSILYRSARIVIIIGQLNTVNGLSKEVIQCVDFLLRNPGYRIKFIIDYFKENKNRFKKIQEYAKRQPAISEAETDFNIVQYGNFPWDLRFNDMLMYLHVRELLLSEGKTAAVRLSLTPKGQNYFDKIKDGFPEEMNFLELFGKRISENKLRHIITEIIPQTYWRENAKLDY